MTGRSESAPEARPFQATYDIIGSLPVEVLLDIVKYFGPADVFRCQRTSKRWRSIFSSDSIIKFFLRETLMFLGIEGVDVSAADAIDYFKWQHRLLRVQPVKKIFLPWPQTSDVPLNIAYRSRRLYYCLPGDDAYEFEMLDLETGERLTWTEDEAIKMDQWYHRLSDRYVVFNAYETSNLIAWDTHTLQRYTRQLPCSFHHTSIHKDKAVIVDYGSNPLDDYESEPLFPIYIWDLSSNRFQKVSTFPNLYLWHMNANEGILVAFEIDWDKHPPEVQETKWTVTGQLVNRKQFPLSLSDCRTDRKVFELSESRIRLLDLSTNITFSHRKTMAQLCFYSDTLRRGLWISLMYDQAIDKLSARLDDDSPPVYGMVNTSDTAILTPKMKYTWDKNLKVFRVFHRDLGMVDMLPYQMDARELHTCEFLRLQLISEVPAPSDRDEIMELIMEGLNRLPLRIFGDREVLGVASCDGIQLWLFNPNFTLNLPNAMPFLPMEESG